LHPRHGPGHQTQVNIYDYFALRLQSASRYAGLSPLVDAWHRHPHDRRAVTEVTIAMARMGWTQPRHLMTHAAERIGYILRETIRPDRAGDANSHCYSR
jgi:hypothetical protein